MKRFLPHLFISVLVYFGCEDKEEIDTTPPVISITSHASGQTVSGIIVISVNTKDNDTISKVDFFVNDSLKYSDTESPFIYKWPTMNYNNGSQQIVKAVSFDASNNYKGGIPRLMGVGVFL